ncbi:MerR family transcriptional regulator [Bacillus thuringiensis]|uniref:MerR family transcriptional regulator n=1 Tax=Bacillus thuringiensis TaxID=1428 RepID=UPI000BFC1C26|nr:MerR family transcriptional regulator [Bacillus thuringiensis]PGT89857.1 hypothetical protein COD17_08900 [Bacillus thuringiensis]
MRDISVSKDLGVSQNELLNVVQTFEDGGITFDKDEQGYRFSQTNVEMFKRYLHFCDCGYLTKPSKIAPKLEGEEKLDSICSITEMAEHLSVMIPNLIRHLKYLEKYGYEINRQANGRYRFTEEDKQALEYMAYLKYRGYTYRKGAQIVTGKLRDLSFTLEELASKYKTNAESITLVLVMMRNRWNKRQFQVCCRHYIFTEEVIEDFARALAMVN